MLHMMMYGSSSGDDRTERSWQRLSCATSHKVIVLVHERRTNERANWQNITLKQNLGQRVRKRSLRGHRHHAKPKKGKIKS
eukprot:5148977-Amphidinium_carterae.2